MTTPSELAAAVVRVALQAIDQLAAELKHYYKRRDNLINPVFEPPPYLKALMRDDEIGKMDFVADPLVFHARARILFARAIQSALFGSEADLPDDAEVERWIVESQIR